MQKGIALLTSVLILWFSPAAIAAEETEGPGSPSSIGGMLGKVIPSGPDGVKEIFGVGGIRYTTSGKGNSQFDMGAIFGAAGHTVWQDLFINTHYNMSSYGFTNHVGVGADILRYRTGVEQTNQDDVLITDPNGNPILREFTKTALGLHILGGLSTALIKPIYVRADMKLNVTPALILTITMGLEWRFGELRSSGK